MAGLIEKTPDMGRNALGNYLAQATTRATEAKSGQGMLARGRKPAENIQAVKEELDAVRREQAKLQQAIYEAAQVQDRKSVVVGKECRCRWGERQERESR